LQIAKSKVATRRYQILTGRRRFQFELNETAYLSHQSTIVSW